MEIEIEPLTAARFAPFGSVIEADGPAPLQRFDQVYAHGGAARTPGFALFTVETVVTLPYAIRQLEHHPHSAQTFLPVLGGACLVFACESDTDGAPRMETARAFRASGRQGVCYRRGVWHHRVSALEAPSRYAVIMTHAREGEDTVLLDLPRPVLAIPRPDR